MNLSVPINPFSLYEVLQQRVFRIVIFLTLLHIPLGLVLYNSQILALVHPLGVLSAGLYFALKKRERLEKVAIIAAYLIGAEVLWRMAESAIFWEFGKYAASAIFLLALIRRNYFKVPLLPLIFFLLLIPSSLITLLNNDLDFSREKLSSIMSGPLLLFISCYFFSYIKLNLIKLEWVLLAFIIPLVSVACTTLFYTVTTPDLTFINDSNTATSGGFGPNQVSSALGLGVMAAFLCLIIKDRDYKFKLYFGFALLFLAVQSALTFSRGGLYNAGAAILGFLIVTFWDRQYRFKIIMTIIIVAVISIFVFPFVDKFTDGALSERFEDVEPSGRAEIVEADLEVWSNNLVFGVGVGNSYDVRREILMRGALAHTEFTRLLSEHGILGLLAIIILVGMSIYNLVRQKEKIGQALVAACIIWSFMFMLNAAMRLAAPSFMLGLCFATITTFQLKKNIIWLKQIARIQARKKQSLSQASFLLPAADKDFLDKHLES